jgi:hypothetical protein
MTIAAVFRMSILPHNNERRGAVRNVPNPT